MGRGLLVKDNEEKMEEKRRERVIFPALEGPEIEIVRVSWDSLEERF
jgi:hypothetical protein